jgi:hypothetical protein
VTVPVLGDTVIEGDETFLVNLTGPTNATLADGQAVGTILNDDFPALSIGDVSVTEGNSGTITATFTVSLSAASASTVTVSYATADGTAMAGSDYVAQTGNLSFAAGQTSRTIAVVVNGDTTVEPSETFVVNLSGPGGATIDDGQGRCTVANDDVPRPAGLRIGSFRGQLGSDAAGYDGRGSVESGVVGSYRALRTAPAAVRPGDVARMRMEPDTPRFERTISSARPLHARRSRAWNGSRLAALPLSTAAMRPAPSTAKRTRLSAPGTTFPSASSMRTVTKDRSSPSAWRVVRSGTRVIRAAAPAVLTSVLATGWPPT